MTALLSYSLVTLDEIKDFMSINGSASDETLKIIANGVTDFIENECNRRRFAQTDYGNEEYDGTGEHVLHIDNYPIDETTGVVLEENNAYDNSDDWSTVDGDEYWVDWESGMITKTTRFAKGKRNYRVDYKGGYATIPSDLKFACLSMVAEFFNRRGSMGLSSESLGDHSVTFAGIMQQNSMIKDVIYKYKDFEI